MKYWICVSCGRMTPAETGFCSYCRVPLPSLFNPPETKTTNEDIFLGTTLTDQPFYLPINFFGYHFAFYGVTGSGKTRLAMKLAIEAENRGLKLLILDVEGEWRNIIPRLRGKTDYYEVEKNLRINPFDLNDIGLVRLLLKETIFKGIEVEYRDLSPQMNYVLEKCIESSASIPSLIENVTYFTTYDLPFDLVNLNRTKTALLVRLEPYKTNPALNEIFYCEKSSLDLNKLDDRNIVFNLHPLEARVAYGVELRLIYNTIAIAYLRQALGRQVTDDIIHMFIADEAQMLAPKILRKLVVTDTWATTEFATRLRKRGESLVIISQSPGNIEDDIRKNAQNIFIFRLQDPEDTRIACGLLGYGSSNYGSDYVSHTISRLEQRQAMVKASSSNEPFMITAPEVSIKRITEEELEKHTPKVEMEPILCEAEREPLLRRVEELVEENQESKQHPATGLGEDEQTFLGSVSSQPFISATERREMLGWSKRRYAKVVEGLIKKGVVEKVNIPQKGRSRPIVLYEPKGRKPSMKHEYYVYWIANQLKKKGLEYRVEKNGPDVQIPSARKAVNVELGTSDVMKNVDTAMKDFDTLIICSDTEKLLENLSREISASQQSPGKRILFSLVWNIPSLI